MSVSVQKSGNLLKGIIGHSRLDSRMVLAYTLLPIVVSHDFHRRVALFIIKSERI